MQSVEESAGSDAGRSLWSFGAVEFDERTLQLRVRGNVVEVEPKPQQLLLLLLQRAGEVITREEILESIWPGRIVTDGVITNCVAKLRSAIGDEDQSIVRTVPRFGYRLVAEVRRRRVEPLAARLTDEPALRSGEPVPGRPDWRLGDALSTHGQAEVRIAHDANGARRVFKFARNAAELAALKREVTLNRVLHETLSGHHRFVRILDWNFDEAPYFVALEYTEHGNLEQWCEAQGGAAALPLELRIELAARCADAVADAHSAGVLHKDLKPSNILIVLDAQGHAEPRLSDFAAGWVLDPDVLDRMSATRLGFTRIGANDSDGAGTPMYIAPEVLAGQMSTARADLYSLGVILFQLVVGDFRAVLAPGWEHRVHDPLLRDDIARAANGDPALRFDDALQLARNLRGLETRRDAYARELRLAAEAEATRQALIRARARRGLLIALAITLSAASLIIGTLYWQARAARDEALAQSRTASAISDFLTKDLLSAADPLTSSGGDLRVRELLDLGSRALDTRFTDSPVVKARLQRVIGGAYGALGRVEQAEPLLLAAERTLAEALGNAHPDVQATRFALRDAYRIALRFPKMAEVGHRIVDAERSAGIPNPAFWFEGRWVVTFAECIVRSGSMWLMACEPEMFALAAEAEAKLGAEHPIVSRIRWITGVIMLYSGRAAAAEPLLRRALEGIEGKIAPSNLRYLEMRLYWGATLGPAGDAERGERELRRALDAFDQRFGRDQGLYRIAQVFYARALASKGEFSAAEALLREALDWRRRVEGDWAISTLNSLESLVDLLVRDGRAAAAVAELQAVLDVPAATAASPFEQIRLHALLGHALSAAGQDAAAGAVLAANLDRARQHLRPDQWYLGLLAGQYGRWLASQGQFQKALPLLEQAASVLVERLGAAHPHAHHAAMLLERARAGDRHLPIRAPTTMPDAEPAPDPPAESQLSR
ncbi:MAG TPA: winged helix-turn-helix domain-containing protein [Fontimonas sp.]